MNLPEARALLVWLSSVDGRHKPQSEEAAETKSRVWSDLLGDVPADFSLRLARRYYSQQHVRDQMLTPSAIRSAWATEHNRLAEADQRAARAATALPRGLLRKKPAWFDAMVRAYESARAQGIPESEVQNPHFTPQVVAPGTPDAMIRGCGLDVCHCTHTECNKGWLDREEEHTGLNGVIYPQVRRCDVCREALEMRTELGSKR